MNEKYYKLWIESIARNSEQDTEQHIRKHIKELESKTMTREWIIYLINLASIAESKLNISVKEKMDRLYRHAKKYPQEFEKDIVDVYEEILGERQL